MISTSPPETKLELILIVKKEEKIIFGKGYFFEYNSKGKNSRRRFRRFTGHKYTTHKSGPKIGSKKKKSRG